MFLIHIYYRACKDCFLANGKLNLAKIGKNSDGENLHIPLEAHIKKEDANDNRVKTLFQLARGLMNPDPKKRTKLGKYFLSQLQTTI